MSACPSDDELIAFALGELGDTQTGPVCAHLASCEPCGCAVAVVARAIATGDSASIDTQPPEPRGAELQGGEFLGRYQVIERLGRGAMGTVYVARDPELNRRVAIKVLTPGAMGSIGRDQLQARLLREAQAMAQLSHPNVVAVHDVGTFREQVFIAMDLIEGMTLHRWLKARKRSWQEVVEVFLNAGRGLAAAHAAGIVHRDFKPENVLVGDDGRVLVTDFGLARSRVASGDGPPPQQAPEAAGPAALRVSRSGAFVGSPAYMAPEQLRGEGATARSDIFSFCVSLHEGLYGARPFRSLSVQGLLNSIERRVPVRPSGARIPLFVRRVLDKGLSPIPEERFASMEEVLRALAGKRGFGIKAAVASIVLAAVAGGVAVAQWRSAPPRTRPSVAVLDPAEASAGGEPWLGVALGELLSNQVSADPRLRVVPAERVAVALRDLRLTAGALSPEDAQALGKRLGVELLVTGTISPRPPLELELSVLDASNGRARRSIHRSADKPIELARALGGELRVALGGGERVEGADGEGAFPRSPEAARLYGEALSRLHSYQPAAARDALLRALAIEPGNPLVLAKLAQVWLDLGYYEKTHETASLAMQRQDQLPPAQRLALDLTFRRAIRDRRGTFELASKQFALAPDDIDTGLLLAEANPDTLMATLEKLRHLPAPQGSDPRIDLAEARECNIRGDWKCGTSLAQRAGAAANALGARRLVADACFVEAQARAVNGDRPGAGVLYGESERIFEEVGDLRWGARAKLMMATVLADSGDLDGARARMEAARLVFNQMGDRGTEARASGNLAILLRRMRRLPEALEMAHNVRTAMLEVGESRSAIDALAVVAQIEMDMGDLDAARTDTETTIRGFRQWNSNKLPRTLLDLAEVELRQGALADAKHSADEATEHMQNDKFSPPRRDTLLARLALEESRPAQAEALARKALEQPGFERPDEAAAAGAALAAALLERGKAADARQAAETAAALISHDSDFYPAVTLARARADAAADPAGLDRAIVAVHEVLTEARRTGVVADLLEAQFSEAAIENAGQRPGAHAHLVAVAKDARARGYLAIARRAERLSRKPGSSGPSGP
jgi:hypothetical protein